MPGCFLLHRRRAVSQSDLVQATKNARISRDIGPGGATLARAISYPSPALTLRGFRAYTFLQWVRAHDIRVLLTIV